MKSKKVVSILCLISMCVSLLMGCGKSPSENSDSGNASAESSSSSAEQMSEEPVQITIFCCYASEEPHGQYIYQYAEKYMTEHPSVTINVEAISSNDIDTKMTAMATTPSELPTLFWTSVDHITAMNDIGIIEDLNLYLSDEDKSMFATGIVEGSTFDDQMSFYPIDVQPSAVIYRKDRFEEEGLEVPKSWEELREIAIKLTKDTDHDGANDQWGFSMVGSNNSSGQSRFMSYLWSQGNKIIAQAEDGTWIPEIRDNEKFLKDFSFWTDLYTVDKAVPDSITEVDYQTAANYFAMGYTSMILSGSNALGVAYSNNPELQGKLGSFVIPGDAPGTMLNAEGYALCKSASEEQKKAAVDFLKFFSTNDTELGFWQVSGKIPATIDGQAADYISGEDYKGYIETVERGTVPTMNFAGFGGLKSALGDAYSAVFAGEKSNADAVENLAEEIDELLEDYN